MYRWFETVRDLHADHETIVRRRYGIIEVSRGSLVAVHLRPWPKLISWPEVWPTGGAHHARGEADRCWLYYNQPLGFANFLALKYIVSSAGSSYATFRAALETLDRIAELKRTDAVLCDAANSRLSERLMRRFGWTAHRPQRWRRNYIKRFYGTYPAGRT
jgi:hypothetical protein